MEFKAGDKVVLSQMGKDKYENTDWNPHELRGSVLETAKSYIEVEWSNGSNNGYCDEDLTLVELSPLKGKEYYDTQIKHTLPLGSEARKGYPIYSGPMKYFPKALAEVAHVCQIGNDKHNPGQPLHWSREKSSDHADCITRHLVDLLEDYGKGVGRDENGIPQVAYIAWRALALAQIWFEENENAPKAPGAK